MLKITKLFGICLITLILSSCGGSSGDTATAPATESTSSQLAKSVKLTGYAGLSLAQPKITDGTQTALLNKVFDWFTDSIMPKAYAQSTVQCNYDLLKLAGVATDGTLTKLPVTAGADDCTTGFIDMYDGTRYILLTASGIYKDGLTCNLVLINKADGNLYCVGERSRSIYKISGADSWKSYEKLQISDDGNYMYLEADSTVFDQNGQVTGIKTKLLRFDLTNDAKGPIASTLVEGIQQSWLNNTFGYNTDSEGFSIKGYQGLNNGDVSILYQRYISTAGTWANKLNAFYYAFKPDGTYDRIKFDDTAINTALTAAYRAATNNNAWGGGGNTQMNWYDISCFFKDSADDNSFIFTIPYYYGYMLPNSTWQSGVQAVIFKGTKPIAGSATIDISTLRSDSAICSESSSMAGPAMTNAGSSRPSKVGNSFYALQTSSGWDAGTSQWSQKTYLVSNKLDGSADVKKLVSNGNTWMGSRKIYTSKNYLFLKSPSTGTAWTSNSQPGDNLWRIDPNATFNPLINGELNPLDYQVVINATEYISIAKIATTSLDNKAKLTGRDLNDPDLAKIIGDIDEAGLFTKAAAANKDLQPVSIVKL